MYEKTITKKTIYEGRILGLETQDVELADGRKAFREIIRHDGAVAILARRPDGMFVFVRQFRKPVEQELFEVTAGLREKGEDAETCAIRELREETGYRARDLVHLGYIFPSPGYSEERIDLFFAETEPASGETEPDEDEHLDVLLLDQAEVVAKIRNNEINDSKTLSAWLLYTRINSGNTDRDGGGTK